MGLEVVILSSRDKNEIEEWNKRWNVWNNQVWVTNHKIPALYYVDDNGIRFNGNYEEIIDFIDRGEKPWWHHLAEGVTSWNVHHKEEEQ